MSALRGPIVDFKFNSLAIVTIFFHILRRPTDFITTIGTYYRVMSIFKAILDWRSDVGLHDDDDVMRRIAKTIGGCSAGSANEWVSTAVEPWDDIGRGQGFDTSIAKEVLASDLPCLIRWLLLQLYHHDDEISKHATQDEQRQHDDAQVLITNLIWFMFESPNSMESFEMHPHEHIEYLIRWILYTFARRYKSYHTVMCGYELDGRNQPAFDETIAHLKALEDMYHTSPSLDIHDDMKKGWSVLHDLDSAEPGTNNAARDTNDGTEVPAIETRGASKKTPDTPLIVNIISALKTPNAPSSTATSSASTPNLIQDRNTNVTATTGGMRTDVVSAKKPTITIPVDPSLEQQAMCETHLAKIYELLVCLNQEKDIDKPGLCKPRLDSKGKPRSGTDIPLMYGMILFHHDYEKMYKDPYYPNISVRLVPERGEGNCGMYSVAFAAKWQQYLQYARHLIGGAPEEAIHVHEEQQAAADLRKS